MYSQRINSWVKTTWKYGTGKSSVIRASNLLVLTFRAMPIATRIVIIGFPHSSQASICPPNSAVLHRFIADKVRNCQVFNPIVSILFQAFSVHRLLGLHCAKVCQWAEFYCYFVANIQRSFRFWWPKSLSVIISMPSSSKCVAWDVDCAHEHLWLFHRFSYCFHRPLHASLAVTTVKIASRSRYGLTIKDNLLVFRLQCIF
jgi:hypothetical protein